MRTIPEWRGCTSTKGYEFVVDIAPYPNTAIKTAVGSVHIPTVGFIHYMHVPKFSFSLVQDGYLKITILFLIIGYLIL